MQWAGLDPLEGHFWPMGRMCDTPDLHCIHSMSLCLQSGMSLESSSIHLPLCLQVLWWVQCTAGAVQLSEGGEQCDDSVKLPASHPPSAPHRPTFTHLHLHPPQRIWVCVVLVKECSPALWSTTARSNICTVIKHKVVVTGFCGISCHNIQFTLLCLFSLAVSC